MRHNSAYADNFKDAWQATTAKRHASVGTQRVCPQWAGAGYTDHMMVCTIWQDAQKMSLLLAQSIVLCANLCLLNFLAPVAEFFCQYKNNDSAKLRVRILLYMHCVVTESETEILA